MRARSYWFRVIWLYDVFVNFSLYGEVMTGLYADFAILLHVHDSISGRQPIGRDIVFSLISLVVSEEFINTLRNLRIVSFR